jgi:hypothetical protein
MKLTDDEILSRIRGEITDSLGYGGEISKQREDAMLYYYGLPFGNEVEGRSQYVDSSVMDTIEWIKPSLMKIFASGDEVVVFAGSRGCRVSQASHGLRELCFHA